MNEILRSSRGCALRTDRGAGANQRCRTCARIRAALFAALLWAALAPCGLQARPLDLGRLSFLPARFRVGEEVELRAEVLASSDGSAGGQKLEAFSAGPADLPGAAGAGCELRSLSLVKARNGWELRIRFVPWKAGESRLPGIIVHNYQIPALGYETASSLGPSDRGFDPPRGQRELAGTSFYIYAAVGLILLIGLFVLGLLTWIIPGARNLLRRWRAAAAYKELKAAAGYLEESIGEVGPPAFYAALSRALRIYLAARVLPGAPSLTPPELASLPAEDFPDAAIRDEAAAALSEADAVRFGGREPDESAMRAAVNRVLSIAGAAEEAIDARL